MAAVKITSFGYLHAPAPAAHIVLDLRHHFRDPHVNPALRELTAHDEPVRTAVLATSGIDLLLTATVTAVMAYIAGPSGNTVTVAAGCAGGRHRAAAFATELDQRLKAAGTPTSLTHRDIDKPVINR